jgi:hypothetical protein
MKICRRCETELTAENWLPSDRGLNRMFCRDCRIEERRQRYEVHRNNVITNLGGKCECCGEKDEHRLSIDHIYGGGHQESLNLRGNSIMTKLSNMPIDELKEKYRCLCYNCNYCIGFYGVCQHDL